MTTQSTIDKLIEMRLTAMADAFRLQINESKYNDVPFEDRLGMLVDIEYTSRKNSRLKRLIHNAGVNDTLRMYKSDDIRMYNFDCITDTIVEVITTCNTYTLLTVHLL